MVSNLDQLPLEAQRVVQTVLADADGDGVPDIFQQAGLQDGNVQVVDLRCQPAQLTDPAARIRKLDELRSAGLISEEEYQAKRAEILNNL